MDEVVKEILHVLNQMFPNAYCELRHRNAFELLCAVILSAQTTDLAVNRVTPALFEAYPTPEKMSEAPIEDIQAKIRSIGLFKTKASHLKRMSTILVERYGGQVPQSREALMELPGVGRKTANVILSVAFGIPALAVDTHVQRVAKRLGLAEKKDSVLTVEKKLMVRFPEETWNKLHHQLIFFGRYHCTSRRPNCGSCPLYHRCTFEEKTKHADKD